jgi:TatD DNase family protein
LKYIDVHTHTFDQEDASTQLLNAFPDETWKLDLPVKLSMGLHPWHVSENWQMQIKKISEALPLHPNILAIGEAGLDKAVAVPYELQTRAFTEQLALAEAHRKPMIIHCVRSYSEMLAIRKKSDVSLPWIFHWFNADRQIAHELIRKNCYLSFGHMQFHEKSKAFDVLPSLPAECIFFETDDAGYKIQEVYAKAADLRKVEVPDLIKQIMSNFARCFQL